MDTLTLLFSSRVKAELFRILFGTDGVELHVREIARRSKLNDATVRQEIRRLTEMSLVASRRDGNRVYVRANKNNPLYSDLHGLVQKTSGMNEVLKAALGTQDIRVAFVFGSLASGKENTESDVDLMLIGDISLRQTVKRLGNVAQQLGRELNPHVLTPKEFASKRKSGDHFVTTVLNAPKLFVIGDAQALESNTRTNSKSTSNRVKKNNNSLLV